MKLSGQALRHSCTVPLRRLIQKFRPSFQVLEEARSLLEQLENRDGRIKGPSL